VDEFDTGFGSLLLLLRPVLYNIQPDGKNMATFTHDITVNLRDTDAAGILYFVNLLNFAHAAFERFMEETGFGLASMFTDGEFHLPIVHAEADYRGPVAIGDRLTVEMKVARIGGTSFTADYVLRNGRGDEVGTCRIVHVAVKRESGKKTEVPQGLRSALEGYMT
jgi:YbgC/YbaW family acyl-CoA thioester hydrolase